VCGNFVPDVAQVAFWTADDLGLKNRFAEHEIARG
jgi:hypothetical protein